MKLTFGNWSRFCEMLAKAGQHSIPAAQTLKRGTHDPFLVLKHDVETNVKKAFRMAQIEQKHGHRGSYYVQAYLLENKKNIEMLQDMQRMGHEISYHYDVLDSNHGDISAAMTEFEKNLRLFQGFGFSIYTLCQHGNPVVKRIGYASNRDFFRAEAVQERYPELCDIMVDYPSHLKRPYLYFSDAGRQLCMIYDPINNDITPSADKDIAFADLPAAYSFVRESGKNAIISVHPHRYASSAAVYSIKTCVFFLIRNTAKLLLRVPICKRLMEKYYFLAKKI